MREDTDARLVIDDFLAVSAGYLDLTPFSRTGDRGHARLPELTGLPSSDALRFRQRSQSTCRA